MVPENNQSSPTTLPLARLREGDNPRRYFDPAKHADLVASLKLRGMLQPVLVRPIVDTAEFKIVAGGRRFRAALEAFGPEGSIPVVVRDLTDQEALEAAIDENDVREDASETEQADAAVRVLAACGGDRAEASRRLGWSPAKLDRRLALANLSAAVKSALDERRIKVGHAELLAAVPADKQDKALENILAFALDVGKTRELLMRVTQSLGAALFDKTECTTCPFNSASQRALFDTHVEDGHCTNPGCFQLKTEAADAAALKAKQAAEPNSGAASSDQTTRGDADATVEPSTPDRSAGSSPDQRGAPAAIVAAPAAQVTAKTLAVRAAPLREAAWRTALARDLAGNAGHAQAAILIAGMTGTIAQIKPDTLTGRADALIGGPFSTMTFGAKIGAIRALPDQVAVDALAAIGAAYAKDVRNFAFVADLARAFEIDLRDSWQVDRPFLEHFNAAELKGIAQECGLVDHMGAKAFAQLLKAPRDGIIDGMLNATGFEWAGRLPSAMTLDGTYGPAPTSTKKD
ncbi:ParB/RepB/Spo0J family partition protein [Sphingomonas sp. BE123]|uniref:PRTRC system ParB family protein n=1 Tax=Sphingomonas sp. BE123 TaxID=2817842 RepID=UPI00285D1118|nr:PRTRC system ParB family protein [Sphingomonas sp. BE123]MDR6851070.1 ParB/RepB/Spo0J family partition protein [Sphingomonas sp. BE123]